MSQALPGTHLCKEHQGNHSHYAPENCELCQAKSEIERLQVQIDSLMHEYCPNEMTPEQIKRWAEHQHPLEMAEAREVGRKIATALAGKEE